MIKIAKVNIKGVIVSNDYLEVYEWFGIEAVSPNKVADQIEEAKGEALEVYINSPGGDVYAGSEIYTLLKEYSGDSVGKIVGLAASAASVAAMGVKRLLISPTAQIMIHNASTRAQGDYRALQHESDVLKNWNTSIANAYMLKSGKSQDELQELMNKESWFNAQQAVENGLADEVMFENQGVPSLAASMSASQLLPLEVVNRVKNEIMRSRQQPPLAEPPTNTLTEPPEPERAQRASLFLMSQKLNLRGRVL